MKNIYIEEITVGQKIDSLFLIENPSIKTKTGGLFIQCTISDRTGTRDCKIWGSRGSSDEEIERYYGLITEGNIYRIAGEVREYKGAMEIHVNSGIEFLAQTENQNNLNIRDYIYSPVDPDETKKKLEKHISGIKDSGIRKIVREAIKTSDGFYEKPAAKKNHHAYYGGLAHHTLKVVQIAAGITDSMPEMDIDRDIIIAGALIHDIGKADTFEKSGFSFKPCPSYSLIGHISPAIERISKFRKYTDKDTFYHLLHIIQSHHGPYGDVLPQSTEAWTVHHADNISAMLNEVSSTLKDIKEGEFGWCKPVNSNLYRFPKKRGLVTERTIKPKENNPVQNTDQPGENKPNKGQASLF
jgi:3'-5' exoribonuclease